MRLGVLSDLHANLPALGPPWRPYGPGVDGFWSSGTWWATGPTPGR